MLKEIFFGKEKIFTLNVILFHFALTMMSSAFVYIFSYSTSFGYFLFGVDSSVFQLVGKFWLEGFIPYKDIFDHKGAILYLVNAIGYAIYPRAGVMVPQIIFLYLSCLFLWRAMGLYSLSIARKIFFFVLMLIFYAAHYEEGNHVEEYDVLFLSVATYFFLRSLKEDKFLPLYGFIYGLCFGACFLIRLSDAAQICCQVFLVVIFLLQDRNIKTLWKNFLSFCAGGALYDMFYGTILFNLKYTDATFHFLLAFQVIYDAFHFLPLFIMIVTAAIALKQNPKSRLLQSAIFIGAMMMFMLIYLRPYLHYALIIFPVMTILFAVLNEFGEVFKKIWQFPKFSFKRLLMKGLIIFAVIHVVISTLYLKAFCLNENFALPLIFCITHDKNAELFYSDERNDILELQKIIPENERNSVVYWGGIITSSIWILQTGIKPRDRIFMNNSHLTRIDPALRKEWFDNVRKNYPLWILYGIDPKKNLGEPPKTYMEDLEVEELLAEKYSFKGEVYVWPQMMKLYRLKN